MVRDNVHPTEGPERASYGGGSPECTSMVRDNVHPTEGPERASYGWVQNVHPMVIDVVSDKFLQSQSIIWLAFSEAQI